MQLPCYADRLTSVLCSFSSLVIRNHHRVAMYFHAPCGVVLYFVVCKLYANKEEKKDDEISCSTYWVAIVMYLYSFSLVYLLLLLDTLLPPYHGIQGKSGNLIFNHGKSRGKERDCEKLGKMREVIELLFFYFRVVNFSILCHTSS